MAVKNKNNENTVTVRLPLSRNQTEDVWVGVNGRRWLIKRGVDVRLPLCAAMVLQRREQMLSAAMDYENALAEQGRA